MGTDEVAYHQATVVGREDDHPGAALDYYGSRGETPLRWGGAGAARLGLSGEVTPEAYERAFGPGGFGHPGTGVRLVVTRRPGFELVVSAHKSVAVLGVIDRADEMHSILDAETAGTMGWLDSWFQVRGGRRGRAQDRTSTEGLTYAVTRHATSRAGDPSPHDHVLVANVVEMLDARGGYKGLDSAALRDTVEAATMVGRLDSAWQAVQLGYAIERDDGPSGNLRHWRIAGVPDAVCERFSKRSDEIAEHLAATGQHGYRARGIAARASRSAKRHVGVDQLLPAWRAELDEIGWPADRIAETLSTGHRALPKTLTDNAVSQLTADVLDVDGRLLANHKVFTRTQLVAEVAPRLYGRDPAELDRVLDRMLADRQVVPLIGVAGARERSYTTVDVLAAEATIARTVEELAERAGPSIDPDVVAATIEAAEHERGHHLSAGQRTAVEHLCGGSAVSVVVGVAGSGKTTALDTAATALRAGGYRVMGTSTSGQAARTLGAEAHVEARTFTSLLWRLDHGTERLDARTVVIVDEAGMADDADLARLALAVERSGASLVLVGDHRQLAAVGPGGALAALLDRRPDLAVTLDTNVRQHDPGERRALAELRDGSVPKAVAWYARNGRIHAQPNRVDTLVAMTEAWAADVAGGAETVLLAWRRVDVADLNRLARDRWRQLGHLQGDDVTVEGGRAYAVGDRVVAIAPNAGAGIVTSEQLTVLDVSERHLMLRTATGRHVRLAGDAVDAEHLDHGYAVTVHRAQGATFDRAHVLAAGGGRELAYVALSRARERSTIYATADDVGQAVGDLRVDWSSERGQRWVTDLRSVETRRSDLHRRIESLEQAAKDLHAGGGRWQTTPEGAAARQRNEANDQLHRAERTASDTGARRSERRRSSRSLPMLAAVADEAQRRWLVLGEPVACELQRAIDAAHQELRSHQLDAVRARMALDTGTTRSRLRVEPNLGQGVGLEI